MVLEYNIDNIPLELDLNDDAALDQYLDYSDIEIKHRGTLDKIFDTIIAVDGAPIVGLDKKDRLISVIRKLFAKEQIQIKEDGIFMPFDKDDNGQAMSQGFLFVDCETPEDAEKAIQQIHMHKFDKLHTFQVNKFLDIEKYSHVPEEWDESKVIGLDHGPDEKGFLREWLLDSAARDQLAMLNQNVTSILWNNKNAPPSTVVQRTNWTDMYFTFSPFGSYFATLHPQGVAIFGGPGMQRIHRFHHPNVSHIDFSPNESYLVTYSSQALPAPTLDKSWGIESVGHHFIIWDVVTGKLMRSFPLPPEAKNSVPWPYFKWSWDEKYFATIVGNQKLSIYETPTFGLLEKKSIPIPGIIEFEWMPRSDQEQFQFFSSNDKNAQHMSAKDKANTLPSHCIAYFVPDLGADLPSQLVILDVRKREKIRQKQIFYARSAKIYFSSNGDYLLYKVDRAKVAGKATFSALEIFRLREKGVPCDTLDIKDNLIALSWEPNGDSLVVITTPDSITASNALINKVFIHFYTMERPTTAKGSIHATPGGIKLVKTLEQSRTIVNSVAWSPKGRFVILAGVNAVNCPIEFYDTQADSAGKMIVKNDIKGHTITTETHIDRIRQIGSFSGLLCSSATWDPTGRYVLIASTLFSKNQETGFFLTDVQGNVLYKHNTDQLRQILWRPRPPTVLSVDKLNQISKKLKTYSKEFDAQDTSETTASSALKKRERQKLYEEWLLFASNALLNVPAQSETKTYY